jgi:hypothetical protein
LKNLYPDNFFINWSLLLLSLDSSAGLFVSSRD